MSINKIKEPWYGVSSCGRLIVDVDELSSFAEFGEEQELGLSVTRFFFSNRSGRNELNNVPMTREALQKLDLLTK